MKSAGIKKGRLSQDLPARRNAVRSSGGALLQDGSVRYIAARGESPSPREKRGYKKTGSFFLLPVFSREAPAQHCPFSLVQIHTQVREAKRQARARNVSRCVCPVVVIGC